jgi:peptide-methionine (S)-S-oxide reductase
MNIIKVLFFLIIVQFSNQAFAAKAYFAGGCFWCMEADFEKVPGVTKVISGFTGGSLKNPTYRGNHQGHYEAVEVYYDEKKVTYKSLVDHFWKSIDPFDSRGQFCDKGPEYLSALFPSSPAEEKIAKASKANVIKKFPSKKVIMPILKFLVFYPIKGSEEGHQDYYKKNPIRYKAYRWNCGRDKRLKEIWK